MCVKERESPVCVSVCAPVRFIATGGVISWKRFNRPWLTTQPANKDKMFPWSCFVLRHAAKEAGKWASLAARWPRRRRETGGDKAAEKAAATGEDARGD